MPERGQACPRRGSDLYDARLHLSGGELQCIPYPDPDYVEVVLSCPCRFTRHDPDFPALLAAVWRSWRLPPVPPVPPPPA